MDLSLNLQAIIAQQLIPTPDGKGRRAAIEILLNSQLISDYIRKGEVHELKEVMTRSRDSGMQTFDQALLIYTKTAKSLIKRRLSMLTLLTIYA